MRKVAAMVLGLLLVSLGAAGAQPAGPEGIWLTASGNARVQIAPCGAKLCGTVVEVLANNSMAGPGASAAAPLRVGTRLLSDLRRDGASWRGRIFNRENGRTYDCALRPSPDGRLEVRAYVAFEIFGRSQIWRRAG